MTARFSPQRWANTLTTLTQLARDYSNQRFPGDPITLVRGDTLPGFDGALYRAPADKKGWGIIYNKAISSPGRINFTLAHEFGHYLLHREDWPHGMECGQQDMVRWDSEYGQIEHQANEFAATLLMPLDDFRRQIDPRAKPSLDNIGDCADAIASRSSQQLCAGFNTPTTVRCWSCHAKASSSGRGQAPGP